MNLKLAGGFAIKNLKANRYLEIPFILATGTMLILFNIMASLMQNEYVLTRHKTLPTFISMGTGVAFIFTFIFVIYANRFLIKRRNKEFALYGILGLEKKHIRKIILIEHIINYSLIAVIAISGGYVFGKLAFMGLNSLMKDTAVKIMDYPFSTQATAITLVYVLFLFVFVYLLNALSIKNASPVELLGREHRGEGEPKNRLVLLLIGLAFLVVGYYIALTINGILKSLLAFFIAVVLVIIATYILFITFSIFMLKIQKKNKNFYYKAKNFLSVSGMIYRMKSSAVGIASIAILSTGVIVTLATTLSIYGSIEAVVTSTMPREYKISNDAINVTIDNYKDEQKKLMDIITKAAGGEKNIANSFSELSGMIYALQNGSELLPLLGDNANNYHPVPAILSTIEAYNSEFNQNVKLADDEVIISSNSSSLPIESTINLGGKNYKTRMVEGLVPGNFAIEIYKIILPNTKTMDELTRFYLMDKNDEKGNFPAPLYITAHFDLNTDKANFEKAFFALGEDKYELAEISEVRKSSYEFNGGFLFLGIIVGIIFLSGTMLITYYKQVSEGSEDREKYQIMKKVGLPDELIKKTTASQVVWMFFLPLAVAAIHSIVSSKIIFQLLGMFGVSKFMDYSSNLLIVGGVFAVVYFVNFKITSNVYYKQVR